MGQVRDPSSLGFYNCLFLVPKPNNKWYPILDLSALNWGQDIQNGNNNNNKWYPILDLSALNKGLDIQNGNPRIHKVVSSARGVGHVADFSDAY